MLIIPDWPVAEHVKAFSTTRQGGVSQPPYQAMNLGMHVGDDAELVQQNRTLLQQQIGLATAPVWLNQIHSNRVVRLLSPLSEVPDADGSYTQNTNLACVVMTADCLPVLLCDKAGTQVAAVHAGWRGLADGVIEAALAKFTVPADRIMAWLGPAIGPSAFEVGSEVRDQFIAASPSASQAFLPHGDKWLADLSLLARLRLQAFGVKDVYGGNLCTYSDAERFYSYRRDGVTGRQASLIWLADR